MAVLGWRRCPLNEVRNEHPHFVTLAPLLNTQSVDWQSWHGPQADFQSGLSYKWESSEKTAPSVEGALFSSRANPNSLHLACFPFTKTTQSYYDTVRDVRCLHLQIHKPNKSQCFHFSLSGFLSFPQQHEHKHMSMAKWKFLWFNSNI